jgi:hypothetical protein
MASGWRSPLPAPRPVPPLPTWPPPVDGYWLLRRGAVSPWLEIQLQGQAPPVITASPEALRMGGRLLPLLRVASVAAWRLGGAAPSAALRIQVRDEDPGPQGLRFDAPLGDGCLLLPDPYALGSEGYRLFREQLQRQPLPPWRERLPLAFWRGASTGSHAITLRRLAANPRYRLCRLSRSMPQWLDARLTRVVQCRDAAAQQAVIQRLQDEQLLAPACEPWYFGLHRFLIEIDGNVNSWGLLWKLLSGSCVLRVGSIRQQWYHGWLEPYRHLVPVAADLSDLSERLAWCGENPQACEAIARNGQRLAQRVVQHLGRSVLQAIDAAGVER